MVVHIEGDKPNSVSVQAQLKSPFLDSVTAEPGKAYYGWVLEGNLRKKIG